MAPMLPNPSPYPLSRSHVSTTRLIAQHALWQNDLRFLLHPTITASLSPHDSPTNLPNTTGSPAKPATATSPPPAPSLRIADLATGTALWSLSLLHEFPQAHITASDASLAQTPSHEWLPPGLEVHEWDFYTPIPQQWVEQFDVVHVRLALLAIKSNDTRTVLESAGAMLKPGGWMQWDELDPEGAYTIVASGASVGEEDVRRFQGMQEMTDFQGLKWVRSLEPGFEDAGFENVGKEVFGGEKSMMGYFQTLQFLVMEEEAGRKGQEARERAKRDVEWGMEISGRGIARVVPKIVVWGQKPVRER